MFSSILATIMGVGKAVWPYIMPILSRNVISLLVIVLPKAREAVMTLWGQDKSGDEKRREAIDAVKQAVLAQGAQVSDSIISLAVELALQRVKATEVAVAGEAAKALAK